MFRIYILPPSSRLTAALKTACFFKLLLCNYESERRHNPEQHHRLEVCENMLLWRMLRPKKESLRKENVHNKELHNLYCAPNSIRVIKSKRLDLEDMLHT